VVKIALEHNFVDSKPEVSSIFNDMLSLHDHVLEKLLVLALIGVQVGLVDSCILLQIYVARQIRNIGHLSQVVQRETSTTLGRERTLIAYGHGRHWHGNLVSSSKLCVDTILKILVHTLVDGVRAKDVGQNKAHDPYDLHELNLGSDYVVHAMDG
jgi:hypothetical protein